MKAQSFTRVVGIIFWILAVLILMATYGVLAKPLLEEELGLGFFKRGSIYYSSSIVISILLLTIGTFLVVYPFRKPKPKK